MRIWDANGEIIIDRDEILNPWEDGAQYILLETADDISSISALYEESGYQCIHPDDMNKIGLYARKACDNFQYIAPVLK